MSAVRPETLLRQVDALHAFYVRQKPFFASNKQNKCVIVQRRANAELLPGLILEMLYRF